MAGLSFEDLNEDETEEVVTDTTGKGLSFEDLNEDETEDKPESEDTVEVNFINSQMYEGMSYAEASKLFQELKEKAESDDPEGFARSFPRGLTYTNKDGSTEGVPTPEADFNWSELSTYLPKTQNLWYSLTGQPEKIGQGPAKVSITQNLGRGAFESLGDFNILMGAGVDKATGLFGVDTDLTEYYESISTEYDTSESIIDSLIADGGPAVLGAFIPGKVAYNALKTAPMLLRGIGVEISAALGGALTTGTDEETLLVGENAAFDTDFAIFKGLDLQDGEASSDAIEARVNVFIEGLVGAGVISTAAKTVKGVTSVGYNLIFKGIVDAFRPSSGGRLINGKDRAIYLDLIERMSLIDSSSSKEEFAARAAEIAQIVKDNSTVVTRLLSNSDDTNEIVVDTISAFIKGDGTVDMAGLLKMRAGATLSDNTGTLQKAITGPQKNVEASLVDDLDNLIANSDADDATGVMARSSDAIVEEGQKIVDGANLTLEQAQKNFDDAAAKIIPTDPDDLEFIDALTRLETASGLDIGVPAEGALTEIKQGMQNAFEAISNRKNALFMEIKGGEVSAKGMIDILDELKPEQLDAALSGLNKNSPLGVLLDSLKSIQRKAANDIAAMVEEGTLDAASSSAVLGEMVEEGMSDFLSSQGVTYAKLYTELRPLAAVMAENAYASTDPLVTAGGAVLRKFVQYIDGEALDFAAEQDDTIKPLALAAKKYYKDSFSPAFRGGGVLQKFGQLYQRTIGRTDPTDLSAQGPDGILMKGQGYAEDLDELLVNELLGSGNPEKVLNLVNLLKTADPAQGNIPLGRAEAVLDYTIFDTVSAFADSIRLSDMGMQGADFTAFSSSLQKYARSLRLAFPEKHDVIQQLVKNLDAAQGSREAMEEVLLRAKELSGAKKEEIQSMVINNFLDRNRTKLSFARGDDTLVATNNYQDKFFKMFTSPESTNEIAELLALADSAGPSQKKIIMDGLKVAYNQHARKTVLNSQTDITDVRQLSVDKIQKAQEGLDPLLKLTEDIYGTDSEFTKAFAQILEAGKVSAKGQRATSNPSQSATAYNKAALSSVQAGINIFLGPLTRLGTQIRTGAAAGLNAMMPDRQANQILVRLLADPEYFLELAAKYNKTPTDPILGEMLEKYLTVGTLRGLTAEDGEESGGEAAIEAGYSLLPDAVTDQTESLLKAGGAVVNAIKRVK